MNTTILNVFNEDQEQEFNSSDVRGGMSDLWDSDSSTASCTIFTCDDYTCNTNLVYCPKNSLL